MSLFGTSNFLKSLSLILQNYNQQDDHDKKQDSEDEGRQT